MAGDPCNYRLALSLLLARVPPPLCLAPFHPPPLSPIRRHGTSTQPVISGHVRDQENVLPSRGASAGDGLSSRLEYRLAETFESSRGRLGAHPVRLSNVSGVSIFEPREFDTFDGSRFFLQDARGLKRAEYSARSDSNENSCSRTFLYAAGWNFREETRSRRASGIDPECAVGNETVWLPGVIEIPRATGSMLISAATINKQSRGASVSTILMKRVREPCIDPRQSKLTYFREVLDPFTAIPMPLCPSFPTFPLLSTTVSSPFSAPGGKNTRSDRPLISVLYTRRDLAEPPSRDFHVSSRCCSIGAAWNAAASGSQPTTDRDQWNDGTHNLSSKSYRTRRDVSFWKLRRTRDTRR